jgi:hypothetical protein
MTRPRIRVRNLLIAVAITGTGIAALRDASAVWINVLFTGVGLSCMFAILAVIYRRESARAWWVGYALGGWSYLAIVYGPWAHDHVAQRLATTTSLKTLHDSLVL